MRGGAFLVVGLSLAAGALAAPAIVHADPDCAGPAGDAAPSSREWDAREEANLFCATQRNLDTVTNPAYLSALLQPAFLLRANLMDPFREPALWNGKRFRFQEVAFSNAAGKRFPGFLFRPLETDAPPYPAVVIMHGGAANQEMYLWAAEALAEAGYMVLSFNIGRGDDTHYEDTRSALDFLTASPAAPAPRGGVNPRWAELDRAHIGLAGHSAGGVAVSRLGQEDPRVSAIVSWDRAQSGRMPAGLRLRTPALFLTADFNCQLVPVCLPVRYSSRPDPNGPGNKGEDFQRVRAAGVDTMKIALRAATHLTFTEFPQANGSRYGVPTALYYTLAWFDRYLKGGAPGQRDLAAGALRRLIATDFDSSADVHNISGGQWDPATGRNAPALIAGQPVANRVSFHFRSEYSLAAGRYRCESMRAGCPPPPPVRCPRGLKFRLAVRRVPRQRIVAVSVYVNGKRRVRRSGRRLKTVSIPAFARAETSSVRIVAKTNRGDRVTSRFRYRNCKQGRTSTRVSRRRR